MGGVRNGCSSLSMWELKAQLGPAYAGWPLSAMAAQMVRAMTAAMMVVGFKDVRLQLTRPRCLCSE